ncbi:hypothetical protein MRX96_031067 [Rhipicephalus microplus]
MSGLIQFKRKIAGAMTYKSKQTGKRAGSAARVAQQSAVSQRDVKAKGARGSACSCRTHIALGTSQRALFSHSESLRPGALALCTGPARDAACDTRAVDNQTRSADETGARQRNVSRHGRLPSPQLHYGAGIRAV